MVMYVGCDLMYTFVCTYVCRGCVGVGLMCGHTYVLYVRTYVEVVRTQGSCVCRGCVGFGLIRVCVCTYIGDV